MKLKKLASWALCALLGMFGAGSTWAADPVAYLDWDDVNKMLTNAACSVYEEYTGQTTLGAGTTYVVMENKEVSSRITVNGTVANPTRLILCDGAKLTAKSGVTVASIGSTTNALIICGQIGGTGMLEATGGNYQSGIGATSGAGGSVTINGGTVTATGGFNAAGIGGREFCAGGTVTINGGVVTANGGGFDEGIGGGAGIGGGTDGAGGTLTINGGVLTANGGGFGAGIGGGYNGAGGTVTINGGVLTANGGEYGAGIGGGEFGAGGTVTIIGGVLTATGGGEGGAGIGGGLEGAGGTVTFGEGKTFVVKAGDAEPGTNVTAAAFAADHSAKYAHIEPGCALKIPAATGYSYVVSNETVEIAGDFADGTNTFAVASNDTVKVYFTLAEGYVWVDDSFENPMDLGAIDEDTVVDAADLPTAGYAITYDYGAGTGPATPNAMTYAVSAEDQTIHLTAPTPAPGYDFTGFSLKDEREGVSFNDKTNMVIAANSTGPISVQANYQVITYTISYEPDDVTGDNLPKRFTVEDKNITVGNVDKEGHTFEGWTCEWLSEPTKDLMFVPSEHLGDVTFTAHWKINTYTLTLPAATEGYTYAISNATTGVLTTDANVCTIKFGDVVKVYFTLAEGYAWQGEVTNPKDLGAIKRNMTVDIADFPKAGYVPRGMPVFTAFAVDTEAGKMSGTIAIRDEDGNVRQLFGDLTATLLGTDDLKNDFESCGDLELLDGSFSQGVPEGKFFFKVSLPSIPAEVW